MKILRSFIQQQFTLIQLQLFVQGCSSIYNVACILKERKTNAKSLGPDITSGWTSGTLGKLQTNDFIGKNDQIFLKQKKNSNKFRPFFYFKFYHFYFKFQNTALRTRLRELLHCFDEKRKWRTKNSIVLYSFFLFNQFHFQIFINSNQ